MAETPTHSGNEPRALTAALSGPAFQTKNSGSAMHAATRHVERWAPEAGANRVRSLRNLGFVDRLVAPWLEVAQKSASLRLFQQYKSEGMAERETNHVSWVFPRPWYQDELDWMAASREAAAQAAQRQGSAPTMFTTRGTFVAPEQRQQVALPGALYEHVAPALSITPPARNDFAMPAALATPVARVHDAYSPLVPFAAVNAAQVMQRAVAPLIGNATDGGVARMSAGLRSVLSTMLERSVMPQISTEPTRTAGQAPELVTPPAPRPEMTAEQMAQEAQTSSPASHASQVVQDVSAQRAQIAELQRAARVVAERQLAERIQQQTAQRNDQQIAQAAQQRAIEVTQAERARAAEAASTVATQQERARVEDRIAQRMAERAAQQVQHNAAIEAAQQAQTQQRVQRERLHEAAREAAARDAASSPAFAPTAEVAAPIAQPRVVPQEITAAIASLSPQLATMVASSLAQQPERMAQTINELGDALRNAELIARSAAAGGSFEQTRGPRLVMPAGLGGLVATVDHNVAQHERRAQGLPFVQQQPAPQARAPMTQTAQPMPMIAPRPMFAPQFVAQTDAVVAQSAMRMPAIAWLAAPGSPAAQTREAAVGAMPTAIAATEASVPAAINHVAWADRWLARFAGANPASLDLLTASSASPATRLQALADAAPGTVFVAPQLDHSIDDSPAAVAAREAEAPVYAPPVRRYDDNEATPDDVFISISRQAARARTPVQQVAELVTADRSSLADAVAHSVPVAPNAGLSAQLASSPFAPAFRHVFPVAAAPTFDVRALFGETLSAAYLAGVMSPAAREVIGGAAIGELPGFETMASAVPFAPIAREAIEWSPAYVAPQPELPATAELGADASPEMIAAVEHQIAVQQQVIAQQQAVAQAQAQLEPLTTIRSALLAWNVESIVTPTATIPQMAASTSAAPYTQDVRVSAPELTQLGAQPYATFAPGSMPAMLGQSMVEAMSLPMIGESLIGQAGVIETSAGETQRVPSFGAPGMIADRAQAWSVAQERSAADLSFDFVTPELVLAAKVYGLGPAEAAQAMRLAIAGPGQLAAMASTVNRTFVQAMAINAERAAQQDAFAAGGFAPGALPGLTSSASTSTSPVPSTFAAPITAYPSYSAMPAQLPTVSTTFGVERKTPRGAFMWPSATVAALGLSAAAPDGEQGMPVAALELLAAQSVAALGTYAALGFGFGPQQVEELMGAGGSPSTGSPSTGATAAGAPAMTTLASQAPMSAAEQIAQAEAQRAEPSESDVVAHATTMVASARRAKFEAMYVALGQSAQARSWSPAAKAARALALAGRGDESITAIERAQIAWSVLPLVAPTLMGSALGISGLGSDEPGAVQSTGTQVQREAMRRHVELQQEQLMFATESRPGLANLSSRAGEALGSYVTPAAESRGSSSSSSSSSSDRSERGAVMRAPSASPELVKTGSVGGVRSTGRFGGGEVEVPTWFEAAARKMLEDRSAGMSGDISLAELTLVQSAPSTHIAASERGVQSAAPANANPSTQSSLQSANQQIDIEKVANEVYKHILTLMDAARARNGEPYL